MLSQCYPQFSSVESHIYWLKYFRHMWTDCPEFTAILKDRYMTTVLFLIMNTSFLFTLQPPRFPPDIYGMYSISFTSNLCYICGKIVEHSPYRRNDVIQIFRNGLLHSNYFFSFFSTLFRFWKAYFSIQCAFGLQRHLISRSL